MNFARRSRRYVYDDFILCIAFPNNSLLVHTIANKLSGHKNPATFNTSISKNMAYLWRLHFFFFYIIFKNMFFPRICQLLFELCNFYIDMLKTKSIFSIDFWQKKIFWWNAIVFFCHKKSIHRMLQRKTSLVFANLHNFSTNQITLTWKATTNKQKPFL